MTLTYHRNVIEVHQNEAVIPLNRIPQRAQPRTFQISMVVPLNDFIKALNLAEARVHRLGDALWRQMSTAKRRRWCKRLVRETVARRRMEKTR